MPVLPDSPVRGVEYFESALLPGKPMFLCGRFAASLLVSRCASMWTEANGSGAPPERIERCRGCEVGAGHAGAVDPSYHRLRASGACARCHRSDLRLIGMNVCVSCQNREYEWVKGRNAKGKFPVTHPEMWRRRVTALVGGVVKVVTREKTTATLELVVEMLRDSPDRVVFGLGRGRVMASDGRGVSRGGGRGGDKNALGTGRVHPAPVVGAKNARARKSDADLR